MKTRLLAVCALGVLPLPGFQTPRETIAKPLSNREKSRKNNRLQKELNSAFGRWLTEDVGYIITDEERTVWTRLGNDEERESFIEQFWMRRDPSPDTLENEYKEEHYRRIAYANDRFASGIPGWKTDRGRIYIIHGAPDEIDSHSSGGTYQRPPEEGGGTTSTFPFEQWRYRNIDGAGPDVVLEFVDSTMTGEYRLTIDPSEKDSLLMVPGAGPTDLERLGLASKNERFNNTDGTRLGKPVGGATRNQFERLERLAAVTRPPAIKFPDLEASVNSIVKFNVLPFEVRADYFPLTESSVLTNITVQFANKDLQFVTKNGVESATVDLHGRIGTLTGRRISVFEDTVTTGRIGGRSLYQASVPLAPGRYRLNLVAKDRVGGNSNNYPMVLDVPRVEPGRLSLSTLVLADLLEKVPARAIGTGQFVIGGTKVRPRLSGAFRQDEKLGIFLKAYELTPDSKTGRVAGDAVFEIVGKEPGSKVLSLSDDLARSPNVSAQQVTIEKSIALSDLAPGDYVFRITVIDINSQRRASASAPFRVVPGMRR